MDFEKVVRAGFAKVGTEWNIKGVLDGKGNIYAISDDTKLISKVFELIALPVIIEAVSPYVEKCELEERQTVYPDLTLILPGRVPNKIAVDIKCGYRRNGERSGFTLGSYTAYMRPPFTKNIRYPYVDYREHWVVGFIYDRVPNVEARIVKLEDAKTIVVPIRNVQLIVAQKWRIASDRPGSGNTANIGSVTSLKELSKARGVFTQFGERGKAIFEDYWRNFDRFSPRKYTDINGYLEWSKSQLPSDKKKLR